MSGGAITVESESLTADADALFTSRGLRRDFAEDVMRIDLTGPPAEPEWADGATLVSWSSEVAPRFHAVYDAAFRERPGFPGYSADVWIAENEEDEDFRPDSSLLVSVPGVGDAGFVVAAQDWIVQVGVVPAARRRGLGAALVSAALARLRADGSDHAWLTVNLNNPGAAAVYRRLGFEHRGRRARYRTEGGGTRSA
ncbi:GNAT family N-acetyltransferase [Paractinoplanes atraurantiacus]|uniref:GNAT family N-acetyltransferase n=1 Tax=Paractinoplanes atraurantiacus TaxID=1036182 RepID=UPI00117759EB|nr:GNAT family N-acetyltransferase [Actinoplanes atraurantiacus]